MLSVAINGTLHVIREGITVAGLLDEQGVRLERVAVEINQRIVGRDEYRAMLLHDGDRVEIIQFVGGGAHAQGRAAPDVGHVGDPLILGGRTFSSRLIVGTGKYTDFTQTRLAVEASGAEIVTVAVRRVNILDRSSENLLDHLNPQQYTILPNTAGCYTAEDAIRTARLARAAGISDFVKLEVIGDQRTLHPDTTALLEAAKVLVKEGFIVLPYTNDDPVVARRLEEVGCAAVMPMAAPIGSGLGICNPFNILIIQDSVKIPVIVDAGVGTPSDAAIAMELGCHGVLMNTGIAGAKDPIAMAKAMRHAVLAGRLGYLAGRIPKKLHASASSPLEGMIE